ncbi:MAG: 50S ribosomal protein L23 [Planctomycetota bacterium]|jgi:large subunit ribosomal protein L23
MNLSTFDILRRPRVTEKAVYQQNTLGHYTFEVHPAATKVQVKDAVERLFNVKVASVRVQNYAGKQRRTRMGVGTTAAWKKAIVRLAADQSIEEL